jgi:MipA family protein
MRRIVGVVAAGTFAVAAAMPASASTIFEDWNARGVTVTVGAYGAASPKYEGSDTYIFSGAPIFNVRPVGTPPRFTSPRDGFGITLFEMGGLAIGPVAQVHRIRRVNTEPAALSEFDRSKIAVELGGFAEYWFASWLRYRLELRHGVSANQGFIADQFVDFVGVYGPWTLSAGPRLRIVDDRANSRSFDISPVQTLTSGIPTYDAGGGVRSVGGGAQAVYRFNPQWAVLGFVEYDRLVSDAGNSSLVRVRGSADQLMVGAGVQYSFDWARR